MLHVARGTALINSGCNVREKGMRQLARKVEKGEGLLKNGGEDTRKG